MGQMPFNREKGRDNVKIIIIEQLVHIDSGTYTNKRTIE